MQKGMGFNNVAIVYIKESAYGIYFWYMSKVYIFGIYIWYMGSNLVDERCIL